MGAAAFFAFTEFFTVTVAAGFRLRQGQTRRAATLIYFYFICWPSINFVHQLLASVAGGLILIHFSSLSAKA